MPFALVHANATDYYASLIRCGDALKNAGYYHAANRVWAMMFLDWSNNGEFHLPGVALDIETDFGNPYYDLAVWRIDGCSLNIPIPILTTQAAYLVARHADFVQRIVHAERQFAPLTTETKQMLSQLRWSRELYSYVLQRYE